MKEREREGGRENDAAFANFAFVLVVLREQRCDRCRGLLRYFAPWPIPAPVNFHFGGGRGWELRESTAVYRVVHQRPASGGRTSRQRL